MLKASRPAVFAALLLAATAVGGPVLAQDDKVLATVDGKPVTEQDLQQVMQGMAQQLTQVPDAAKRRVAMDRVIDMRVLANQAAKDGLDKGPEFQAKLEAIRQQLLINEFVKSKVENSVTDDMLKARYEKDVAAYTPPDEIRARHILVKTKEEAEAIIADLAKGGDFEKIATEKSQDPGSAKEGGDLGYFGPGDMVQPFEEAAKALQPGDYTKTPVETQFGFHVIKLEDKRKQKVPPLDEVKEQIRQAVVGERFTEILAEIKKNAKIDITDATLKP